MMAFTLDPQLFRQKLAGLGIHGLNSSGSFGKCPICSRGVIKINNVFWYTVCCQNNGSLIDLAVKLKHQTRQQAEETVAEMLHSPGDIATVRQQAAGVSTISQLWNKLRPLSAVASLNAFEMQVASRFAYNANLSHNLTNIHQTVRVVTISDAILLSKQADDSVKRWLDEIGKSPLCLVVPTYYYPGTMNGLIAFRYNSTNQLLVDTLTADGFESIGVVAHSSALLTDKPIVVLSDLGLWAKLTFWQNHTASDPSTFAFVQCGGSTKSLPTPILTTRKALYWGEDISGEVSKLCYDHSCDVTTFGISGGTIRSRDLSSINPAKPLESLAKRAMSVESFLTSRVRQSMPQEAALLLAASMLPPSTTEAIAAECSTDTVKALQTTKYDTCPLVQVSVSGGTLEQKADGWSLIRSRNTEAICSHSFRVKDQAGRHNLIVELFYANQWHELVVDRDRFFSNAFETVATASAGIGLFTYDPTYSKFSANWCMRLNPVADKPVVRLPLGVDVVRRTVCTNSLLIQGYPVSMSTISAGVDSTDRFMHLADGQTPDIHSLKEVISHRSTFACMSMLAAQLLRYFNGETPYVVCYGEKLSPLVLSMLRTLEIRDEVWPCDFSKVETTLPLLKYRTQVEAKTEGIWLPVKSGALYWLTGIRPVVYLGHAITSPVKTKQRQLHRMLASLVFEGMRINEAKPLEPELKIIDQAWGRLVDAANAISGTAMVVERPSIRSISMIDAIGFWLRHAVKTEVAKIHNRKPRTKASLGDIVVTGGKVTFRRDLLNTILAKNGLPAWDNQSIVLNLHSGPGFISFEENFGHGLITCSELYLPMKDKPSADGNADSKATA